MVKSILKSFGLGNYLNNDLPIGKKGVVPDSEYYDRWYPDFRWGATTTLSNSIGQGEILTTPIQLANMTAAIANWQLLPLVANARGNKSAPILCNNLQIKVCEGMCSHRNYKKYNSDTPK